MTENEAIEILKYYDEQPYFFSRDSSADYAFKMAIQALEKQSMVNEILNELREYSSIGTVEEFKALKEKSVAKKVKGISLTHEGRVGNCPVCGKFVRHQEQTVYCSCEQKLDWSK